MNLQDLPSVDEVLIRLADSAGGFPRALVVNEVRRTLAAMRDAIRSGGEPGTSPEQAVLDSLAALARPSLRGVINATGVVLHTNLGRAPLPALGSPAGYSNLEYDLAEGRRGRRDVHTGALIERLLGSPGIVVNNNAAAVFLALNELAAGFEVIVSRGELIEIGDGFRIPDIMARSGAILREVGTTNRTHIDDYRAAISERTRLLLRVHRSNFRITGFTAQPELKDLAALARDRNIPLYEDLGSGCLADLRSFGIDEPPAGASLAAGVDLISFSGDKMLGGPQAGILAGRPGLVAQLRRNPMFRTLRVDKLILHALETTLRHALFEQWDGIPALRMIRATAASIRERAANLAMQIDPPPQLLEGESVIGGGSTPERTLPTWLLAFRVDNAASLERNLRRSDPPVIARLEHDALLIDLRTVFPEDEPALVAAIRYARSR